MSNPTSKVWMITGASRGFGAEIAAAALERGHRVVGTARRVDSLPAPAGPEKYLRVALDVTSREQAENAVCSACESFGQIDVLVNNAGYGLLGSVEETSAEEIERLFQTNVFGLLHVTRAVLPIFRKQRSGHIINMSSVGGFSARPGWGPYSATKFAVEALTESLHAELAPLGIHVTAVEPGSFRTDFLDTTSLVSTKNRIPDYDSTVGKMREFVVGRSGFQPGDPKKLAQAILQLADLADPPVRLPLGTDTLRRIDEKQAFVKEETERWRTLSASTDFV
ncbi:short-chain dehydrogenase/reductase SDR [Candidatus Koribacter versatilis Ellin345]|uniref:Short-chain dehydrogenase/reductase SDR n=1 Tax=Koribacter versatilis (strain Ellin345) TaxID=204669 RepID=Q1INP7_KORVE|nr:oxidoreductase [Candidatus Koribacter versatilis]ABF41503.1 short-chain dehydrogenase/reductase SDR [Candidatus Koribacter versatilis Ellin345]